jgi:hypothetical protein
MLKALKILKIPKFTLLPQSSNSGIFLTYFQCLQPKINGSLIPSTRYIFYPKGLAPLSERIENNGASPFGFKKNRQFCIEYSVSKNPINNANQNESVHL